MMNLIANGCVELSRVRMAWLRVSDKRPGCCWMVRTSRRPWRRLSDNWKRECLHGPNGGREGGFTFPQKVKEHCASQSSREPIIITDNDNNTARQWNGYLCNIPPRLGPTLVYWITATIVGYLIQLECNAPHVAHEHNKTSGQVTLEVEIPMLPWWQWRCSLTLTHIDSQGSQVPLGHSLEVHHRQWLTRVGHKQTYMAKTHVWRVKKEYDPLIE